MTSSRVPRRRSSAEVSGKSAQLRAQATADDAALAPGRGPIGWFWRLLVDVIRKSDRDRLLGLAAESAFFAILTLFPALLVVAAVLGELGAFIGRGTALQVEEAVLEFLDRVLTDSAAPVVETVRSLFDSSGGLLTLASALALASLSTAFATLVNTINIAYDVPETRGWWRRRALGLVLGLGSILTGAVAVTALVIGPLFGRTVDLVNDAGLDQAYYDAWRMLRGPVAFAALVLWATTMQHFCPADRHKWRHDIPGGLLTALLWGAASVGLNVYLTLVLPESPVLGALGGGIILMIWFYLLCVALLAGAELNAILAARRRWRRENRAARDDEERHRAEPDSRAGREPEALPERPTVGAPGDESLAEQPTTAALLRHRSVG